MMVWGDPLGGDSQGSWQCWGLFHQLPRSVPPLSHQGNEAAASGRSPPCLKRFKPSPHVPPAGILTTYCS